MFRRSRKQGNRASLPGEIFPPLDFDAIRRQLRLEARGLENGRTGHPDSDAADFHPVEREIVATVETVRREGLKTATDHDRVYCERIAAGTNVGPGLRQIVNNTETNFRKEVDQWRGRLNDAFADFSRAEAGLEQFRQDNTLNRDAWDTGGLWKWAAICVIVILTESILNGVFFAETNIAGLAGGVAVALTVSLVNVGIASIAGHAFRQKNHAYVRHKFVGWLFVIAGVALAVFVNFLVGHFRDLTATVPWDEAAGAASMRLLSGQLQMQSLDAWLLTGFGLLIAAFAGWKAYGALDPYPGYSRISDNFERRREEWRVSREEAFDALTETRDEAATALKDEYDNVRKRFDDANAAREGLRSLSARRRDFLQECDRVAGDLLAIYRDANRKVRSTPEPAYFRQAFSFPAEKEADDPAPADQEAMARASDLVEQAVERIHQTCSDAMDSFGDDRAGAR